MARTNNPLKEEPMSMNVSQAGAVPTQQGVQPELNEMSLVEEKGSYYVMADLQKSAAAGPQRMKVDKELAETILKCAGSGGRISKKESAEEILAKITDGGKYGEGEKELTRLLLSACDDRKDVKLNGVKLRLTDPAETILKKELPKFWGSLASKDSVNMKPIEQGFERVQQNKYI